MSEDDTAWQMNLYGSISLSLVAAQLEWEAVAMNEEDYLAIFK
ncbi:hypothetical protein [Hahella ganghwensis]|nr:hypothetical protein [Hahella ganghwensis]